MSNGWQTETEDGSGRNQQQNEPPPEKISQEKLVRSRPKPPDTPLNPDEQANGGAHPSNVKNR